MMGFSDPVSSLSHFLGAALFLGYTWPLARRARGHPAWQVSLAVFSAGAIFLFSMSGVFHLLSHGIARDVVQRLDHAAIFIFIAATFTPIHVLLFKGPMRWGLLAFVWTCAVVGVTLKSVFFTSTPYALGAGLYLGMGWVGLVSGIALGRRYGIRYIVPLMAGGLSYSIGAVADVVGWPVLWPGVLGSHELFHVAVLIGAACHWAFVRRCVDTAVAQAAAARAMVTPTNPILAAA